MTLNHLIRDELWIRRMAVRPGNLLSRSAVPRERRVSAIALEHLFNATESRHFTQDMRSMIHAALRDGHGLRVAD